MFLNHVLINPQSSEYFVKDINVGPVPTELSFQVKWVDSWPSVLIL